MCAVGAVGSDPDDIILVTLGDWHNILEPKTTPSSVIFYTRFGLEMFAVSRDQSINQTSIAPISPAKPGSVVRWRLLLPTFRPLSV